MQRCKRGDVRLTKVPLHQHKVSILTMILNIFFFLYSEGIDFEGITSGSIRDRKSMNFVAIPLFFLSHLRLLQFDDNNNGS